MPRSSLIVKIELKGTFDVLYFFYVVYRDSKYIFHASLRVLVFGNDFKVKLV